MPATSPAALVAEFLHRFGIPARSRPANPGCALADSRQQLLEQTVQEVRRATDPWDYPSGAPAPLDIAEVARGLADVVLTAYATAAIYGIQLDPVIAEVHRSNLTQRLVDAHGHARQGREYSPPDVAAVLAGQHDGSDAGDRVWWLEHVAKAMGEGSGDRAEQWLDGPEPQLAGLIPWRLIRTGYAPTVWQVLTDLRGSWGARDAAL